MSRKTMPTPLFMSTHPVERKVVVIGALFGTNTCCTSFSRECSVNTKGDWLR